MLQHTGMEIFGQSSQCSISYTINDGRYLKKQPDAQYPVFRKNGLI